MTVRTIIAAVTAGMMAVANAADETIASDTMLTADRNPQVSGINRERARFYAVPLSDVRDALRPEEPSSLYVIPLDGTWKFHWCGAPTLKPDGFEAAGFDDSDWDEIDVPSCVEMRGYGVPHYTGDLSEGIKRADAVILTTPTKMHFRQGEQVMRSGKPR